MSTLGRLSLCAWLGVGEEVGWKVLARVTPGTGSGPEKVLARKTPGVGVAEAVEDVDADADADVVDDDAAVLARARRRKPIVHDGGGCDPEVGATESVGAAQARAVVRSL